MKRLKSRKSNCKCISSLQRSQLRLYTTLYRFSTGSKISPAGFFDIIKSNKFSTEALSSEARQPKLEGVITKETSPTASAHGAFDSLGLRPRSFAQRCERFASKNPPLKNPPISFGGKVDRWKGGSAAPLRASTFGCRAFAQRCERFALKNPPLKNPPFKNPPLSFGGKVDRWKGGSAAVLE